MLNALFSLKFSVKCKFIVKQQCKHLHSTDCQCKISEIGLMMKSMVKHIANVEDKGRLG